MNNGERVWFKTKKISGVLYNNGIITSVNPDNTLDIDIGITNLVIKTSHILPNLDLEDLNGTRVVAGCSKKTSPLASAA